MGNVVGQWGTSVDEGEGIAVCRLAAIGRRVVHDVAAATFLIFLASPAIFLAAGGTSPLSLALSRERREDACIGHPMVFITRTGECYHLEGCESLKQSKIPVTVEDAEKRGLRPCKACWPSA